MIHSFLVFAPQQSLPYIGSALAIKKGEIATVNLRTEYCGFALIFRNISISIEDKFAATICWPDWHRLIVDF